MRPSRPSCRSTNPGASPLASRPTRKRLSESLRRGVHRGGWYHPREQGSNPNFGDSHRNSKPFRGFCGRRARLLLMSLLYGACAPTPREETHPTGAMPVRRRRGRAGAGGSGAKPPSICFLRAAARGGRPDTSGGNSPTGAMPVRRRRGGREGGFGGRAPESICFLRAASRAFPRHLRKKQAQPERCRSAGVAEGGRGVRGQSPRASVS